VKEGKRVEERRNSGSASNFKRQTRMMQETPNCARAIEIEEEVARSPTARPSNEQAAFAVEGLAISPGIEAFTKHRP